MEKFEFGGVPILIDSIYQNKNKNIGEKEAQKKTILSIFYFEQDAICYLLCNRKRKLFFFTFPFKKLFASKRRR